MGNQCCASRQYMFSKMKKSLKSLEEINRVKVVIRKCNSERGDIFDRQLKQNMEQFSAIMTRQQTFLQFNEKGLTFNIDSEKQNKNEQSKIYFLLTTNDLEIVFPEGEKKQKIWKIVEFRQKKLQLGDQIRIGRVHFTVKLIKKAKNKLNIIQDKKDVHDEEKECIKSTEENEVCRICFEPSEEKNPLIKPCNCSGSLNYIHKNCLQKWIFSSEPVLQNNSNIVSISLQRNNCQICQSSYQNYIAQVLESNYLQNDNGACVVLQKNSSNQYLVFYYNGFKRQYKIGRGKSCDYQSKQCSVSKSHCSLIYDNQELKIRDLSSRFGTAILSTKVFVHEKYNIKNLQLSFYPYSQ